MSKVHELFPDEMSVEISDTGWDVMRQQYVYSIIMKSGDNEVIVIRMFIDAELKKEFQIDYKEPLKQFKDYQRLQMIADLINKEKEKSCD